MKKLAIGILAHVDSGKTTLSEGLLFSGGAIAKRGRVDHRDAFLDTDTIEKDRGITIFSKQAVFEYKDSYITLLDTPGHVDFSAEMERSLKVMDYAILTISGGEGVQSHTRTLWNLLSHYGVPTFIFVNKMDLVSADKDRVMDDIKASLCASAIDFDMSDAMYEDIATADSELMEEYFDVVSISRESITKSISGRRIFPCLFGSALKNEGIDRLLDVIDEFTNPVKSKSDFGARVFKISEDDKGTKLTHIKITGGKLKVRDVIESGSKSSKINEIRIYSGAKYKVVQSADAGMVCAVTGLDFCYSGQGLGIEDDFEELMSEAVFTYSVRLPDGYDISKALEIFTKLAKEETQMNVSFNPINQKINLQIMGEVQLEVLKRILSERFGLDAEFENGSIVYKETIEDTVEGVGHFEPLRHYAEVHLKIEPGKRGSGIVIKCNINENELDRNWQRLVATHLAEKTHLGVLTGSPLTDVKISLVSGRAHIKHTEGGDFRQATYRAVRQGLMQAKSVLLEPWYSFCLEVPLENTGRALMDMELMSAKCEAPETKGDITIIRGRAPIAKMGDYHMQLIAYTHGEGRISCSFSGYEPCANQDEVIDQIGYNCEADVENTPDSVFCSHGSGYTVKWDEVFNFMHIPLQKEEKAEYVPRPVTRANYSSIIADDEELLRIFEATYGKVKRDTYRPMKSAKTPKPVGGKVKIFDETYLLIDGYNIIFAWDELKEVANDTLDGARMLLINKVCNYKAMRDEKVILVFDAYKVKGSVREIEEYHGVSVVYTKEAETADAYIEKTSKILSKNYRVRVATSDNLEQVIVFGNGAFRVTAAEFKKEVMDAEEEMRRFISK